MKNKKKKKRGLIDTGTIVLFAVVFLLTTAAITVFNIGTEEEDFHPETIIGENGEEIEGKVKPGTLIFETNEEDERLSRDMTPIVIDENSPFYEAFTSQDRVNVLMLGLADMMTDTIMVASYDMENQNVSIISIPRDTYYFRKKTSNEAENKINCFYRTKGDFGGAVGVATAVSDILCGMPINYYCIVEYDDIRAIMDVIGGVEINIPFHMKYDDTTKGKELHIDIPEGNQTIDSSNVVEFLRFRHTNPWFAAQGYKSYREGDIARTEVHREFIQKVVAKCLKVGNLVPVVECALENIESDLTYGTAVKVAKKAMKGLNADDIRMYGLPGTDATISELSFWKYDEKGVNSMLEEIYGLKEEPASQEGAAGEGAAEGSAAGEKKDGQ